MPAVSKEHLSACPPSCDDLQDEHDTEHSTGPEGQTPMTEADESEVRTEDPRAYVPGKRRGETWDIETSDMSLAEAEAFSDLLASASLMVGNIKTGRESRPGALG